MVPWSIGGYCVQLSAATAPPTAAKTLRVGFQAVQPDTANPELELFGELPSCARRAKPGRARVEAHDARDHITDQIVITGNVDMNNTGTYLLTYSVQDGGDTTATRTVTVTGNRTVDLNTTVAMDDLVSARYFYHG